MEWHQPLYYFTKKLVIAKKVQKKLQHYLVIKVYSMVLNLYVYYNVC